MAAAGVYFDTSVVVKRYVRESGTELARSLMRRHQLLSSAITPAEITSALCRRHAVGELSKGDFADVLARLRADRANWNLVAVSSNVLEEAELVLQRVRLRTLDAIQIASARKAADLLGRSTCFATADARQRDAAAAEGLDVIWVQ